DVAEIALFAAGHGVKPTNARARAAPGHFRSLARRVFLLGSFSLADRGAGAPRRSIEGPPIVLQRGRRGFLRPFSQKTLKLFALAEQLEFSLIVVRALQDKGLPVGTHD